MGKANTTRVDLNREFKTLHILYIVNAGISAYLIFALTYLGAHFTAGILKAAVLYTGGFLFINYSIFCAYRHVRIWKYKRAAVESVRFYEKWENWGNDGRVY